MRFRRSDADSRRQPGHDRAPRPSGCKCKLLRLRPDARGDITTCNRMINKNPAQTCNITINNTMLKALNTLPRNCTGGDRAVYDPSLMTDASGLPPRATSYVDGTSLS